MKRLFASAALIAVLLSGCGSAGVSVGLPGRTVTAPDSLGKDWPNDMAYSQTFEGDQHDRAVENATVRYGDYAKDAKLLSESFGGASAVVEMYVYGGYEKWAELRAVAKRAPVYFAHYLDEERRWIDYRTGEVRTIGTSTCLVRHTDNSGTETDENTSSECMRTSDDLTVWIGPITSLPEDVAHLVDTAWVSMQGSDHDDGWSPDGTGEVAVPDAVGPFSRFEAQQLPAQTVTRFAEQQTNDVAALRKIYGEASVAQGYYLNDELDGNFYARVIASSSPIPYTPYENVERLDYYLPRYSAEVHGDVTCQIFQTVIVTTAENVGDAEPEVQWCQRTGPGLTVIVDGVHGTIAGNAETIAALVDEIWAANSN